MLEIVPRPRVSLRVGDARRQLAPIRLGTVPRPELRNTVAIVAPSPASRTSPNKMLGFIEIYDQTAKPFSWTYTGKTLKHE